MSVRLHIRNPWRPHQTLLQTALPPGLRYGFILGEPSSFTLEISRGDPHVADQPYAFRFGAMVSLERDDGLLPWVGYITESDESSKNPTARFTCQDHAGALFAISKTPRDWLEQTGAAGNTLRSVFHYVDDRALPPLMVDIGTDMRGGPSVAITPRAESFLQFLNMITEGAGYEWGLYHSVLQASVRTTLEWRERLGQDRRASTVFADSTYADAQVQRSASGYLAAAMAVGGSGTFSARPAGEVTSQGLSEQGIVREAAGALAPAMDSPIFAGTRVITRQSVTGTEGLTQAARAQFRSVREIRERVSLQLVESRIQVSEIELGSYYGVEFADLNLGLGHERVVRCIGLGLGDNGILEMTAEVVDD